MKSSANRQNFRQVAQRNQSYLDQWQSYLVRFWTREDDWKIIVTDVETRELFHFSSTAELQNFFYRRLNQVD